MTHAYTDEQLMLRHAQGDDPQAFQELFRRHAKRLHGFFLRSTGEDAIAHDLVQQTFLHVHRARADFRADSHFRGWLYTIATNVRRELFRRRARKPEAPLDALGHREPSVDADATTVTQRTVRRALQELPEAQREVVVLHWYAGWSFPEIAQMVGSTHAAVKVRAHRGYERLRALLGEEEG